MIIDLLSSIRSPLICSEDDIMPLISEAVEQSNMRLAESVVTYLSSRNVKFTAKLYSLMLKGSDSYVLISKTITLI